MSVRLEVLTLVTEGSSHLSLTPCSLLDKQCTRAVRKYPAILNVSRTGRVALM